MKSFRELATVIFGTSVAEPDTRRTSCTAPVRLLSQGFLTAQEVSRLSSNASGERKGLELLSCPRYVAPPASNAGVTQLVECNLAKVDVASSSLVTRSISL